MWQLSTLYTSNVLISTTDVFPSQRVSRMETVSMSWRLMNQRDIMPTEVFKCLAHDDVIQWKHFPRHWSFVRGIHRSPVNSPHKGQWRGALMFSLSCVGIKGWVNNRKAGDLRRYRAHYDVIVMANLFGELRNVKWDVALASIYARKRR